MNTPTVVATVTGASGFETCYVSFKNVISIDGSLTATPSVVADNPNYLTIDNVSVSFVGTINGVGYAAGEVLSFRATSLGYGEASVPVDITYQTANRRETMRVHVVLADWAT